MKAAEITKTKVQVKTNATAAAKLTAGEKINVSLMAAAFAITAVIGLWSFAALAGL